VPKTSLVKRRASTAARAGASVVEAPASRVMDARSEPAALDYGALSLLKEAPCHKAVSSAFLVASGTRTHSLRCVSHPQAASLTTCVQATRRYALSTAILRTFMASSPLT